MNYDETEIAKSYDRARAFVPETARQWKDLLAPYIPKGRAALIADIGCGTGRFSEMFATYFGARVIGIDPSQNMLEQARNRSTTESTSYVQAVAEALPLAGGSADLAFMSMIYHHLSNPLAAARECHRILRRGGYACIRNSIRDDSFPHEPFFPTIRALIDAETPSKDDIESIFSAADFSLLDYQSILQVTASDWASFCDKLTFRADSHVGANMRR